MGKMKRGPKPRQVTQELLEQIEHHAARGLSQKQICDSLGFSETWWHAKKAEFSELGESYKIYNQLLLCYLQILLLKTFWL